MKSVIKVVLVVSIIIDLGALVGLIGVNFIEKLSVDNTKEFTATITDVNIEITETGEHFSLYTKEHGYLLVIMNNEIIINENDFKRLKSGQTIFFRISNNVSRRTKRQSKEFYFEEICSLKTAEKEIISLESYNAWVDQTRNEIVNKAIPLGAVSLLASIICILFIRNLKNLKK